MKLCPVQDVCVKYKPGSRLPPNNDVRNKYICRDYTKGCKLAFFYEYEIMGITSACSIN